MEEERTKEVSGLGGFVPVVEDGLKGLGMDRTLSARSFRDDLTHGWTGFVRRCDFDEPVVVLAQPLFVFLLSSREQLLIFFHPIGSTDKGLVVKGEVLDYCKNE